MSKLPTKSELWIIKKFLLNAVNCIGSESISDNHDLITWILSNQDQLQLPKTLQLCEKQIHAATKDENRRSARGFGRSNNKALMDIWKDWHTKFARHVNYTKSSGANKLQVSAEFIGKICDLESYEVDIIIFIALAEKFKIVKSLSYAVEDSLRSFDNAKKGVCEESIHRILAAENLPLSELNTDKLKVAKYGIVEERYSRIYLSHNTRKIFQSEVDDEEKLKELILGKANSANLEIDEFNYLGGNVEILTKLLKAHSEKSQKPLNIFLYGSPGTGKTEFAKTLGRAANREVYFIGEQDENNEDPSRADRISALMLFGGLNDIEGTKLLVVDEADEILCNVGSSILHEDRGSKIFLNRLLERIKTPVIWIINKHRRIDEAVLRRMNYCLEFPKPPVEVRKSIICKIANNNSLHFEEKTIDELARYETSPAFFENAIRLGNSINGNLSETTRILENNLQAIGKITKQIAVNSEFNIELCNANMDFNELSNRVKKCPSAKLTFCFSGAPGTGKSEYARFLAKEMGYEILYKRYSDLSSMWVGGTEENIAKAFREASQKKAFLILDEADSLLLSRDGAQKSWEVTQVNEFLTQIENHEYPFAITTNSFEKLDTAAMRRFLFKVKFEAMTRDQVKMAYQYFFGANCPNELQYIDNLTPADFALVRNQTQILGINDASKITQMLIEEAATRGNVRQRIGF